jgi:peptidoglycan/xylan/chitin deacetylase (PgdA/CDA1 family)
MPPWKLLLLNLYYHGSLPWRTIVNRQRQHNGRAPIIVLFAHRIADEHPNAWTEPNALFERQIRWLKRRFEFVSLAEAQRRIRLRRNERTCIALTFDDGYADNCRAALPLLLRERVPFTYFVSTHYILTGEAFPHDAARGCPLVPNTPGEIRELARAGVDIGAHTRTHPDLGPITDVNRLYDELVVARHELEEISGARVRYFAFPFGQHKNLNSAAFQMASSAGYAGVCSAYGGYNFPGDDPFHIQRIHLDNDMIRLKNWVTFDPGKLRSIRRYDPDLPAIEMPAEAAGVVA